MTFFKSIIEAIISPEFTAFPTLFRRYAICPEIGANFIILLLAEPDL